MFQIYLLLLIKSQSDGRDFLRDHSEFILSLFSLSVPVSENSSHLKIFFLHCPESKLLIHFSDPGSRIRSVSMMLDFPAPVSP
jgi:hypothetical protein